MVDQRSHVRFAIRGAVKIKTESDPQIAFRGELLNISFRGFSVYVKEKLAIATDNIVQFELIPEVWHRPLIGKGKIRGILEDNKYGMHGFRIGVELIDVDKNVVMMYLGRIQSEISRERKKRSKNQIF